MMFFMKNAAEITMKHTYSKIAKPKEQTTKQIQMSKNDTKEQQ